MPPGGGRSSFHSLAQQWTLTDVSEQEAEISAYKVALAPIRNSVPYLLISGFTCAAICSCVANHTPGFLLM